MLESLAELAAPGVSMKLLYGLAFMFFTLLMASLSDLRKMSIKAEFLTMWLAFSILMLFYDLFTGMELLWIKWLMICALGFLSWKGTGKIFSLARADVVAISAVCSALEIPYIILFYIILILVNRVGVYPLKIFGKKDKYPFMPVIWFSLLILIVILGVFEWNSIRNLLGSFSLTFF